MKIENTDLIIEEIITHYVKYGGVQRTENKEQRIKNKEEGSKSKTQNITEVSKSNAQSFTSDSDAAKIIQQAYEFAKKHHAGVKRKSGEPYINHPVQTTKELLIIEPDVVTIVATLIHDTISHGTATLEVIKKTFGEEVGTIAEALNKISLVRYRGDKATVERLQRTMIAMAQDVRSIFVKFADRIHNLRTIQYHEDPEKIDRIANESLLVYAPLAARLGLYSFKDILETLALRALDLDGYLHVSGELAHYTLEQEQFLTASVAKIRTFLPKKYQESVSYRVKSPYSIYRKLKQQNAKSIHDIYDVFAIRIIVDSVSDCYAVLGIIHGNFKPVDGRFKDFIAVPKSNGYQSLHTTILGLEGYRQPIEIQIRTKKMDEEAERGTAAHVLYKVHGDWMQKKDGIQDLVQIAMDTFLQNQGSALGKKIIFPTLFVFTPRGDVFELPHGSTPVDFAYAVHSDVGYHALGARINGKIATLDTHLCDGDVVEILTSPQAHPVAQWLDFVVSSKARSHIDIEVKRLSGERTQIIEKGKHMLLEAFHTAEVELADDLSNFSQYSGSKLDTKKIEELLYHIGQGIQKPSAFLPRKREKKPSYVPSLHTTPSHTTLIIGGEKHIPHQIANCCRPTYPADVIAVLRTGGKCMIHSVHCSCLSRVNPSRILAAYWHNGSHGKIISFSLLFHDVPGLLHRVTKILYEMGINIVELDVQSLSGGLTRTRARVEIGDLDVSFLDRFTARLKLQVPEFLSLEHDSFDK